MLKYYRSCCYNETWILGLRLGGVEFFLVFLFACVIFGEILIIVVKWFRFFYILCFFCGFYRVGLFVVN